MKKIELLAPAGSMEALVAAVSSGADAVYLGGIRFGARSYANNFNQEEIIEAVKYCHVRGVFVYVTVNTLIYENELEDVLKYVQFLYDAQVDALIVQDLGLFELVKEKFSDFEIHCSTQMHIHNLDGVKFMKEKGADRVVLARESSIDLIRECSKEGIDLEVFVHGALCMGYSGQCLMSSFQGGRSGNRGECAQPCRLKYTLQNETLKKNISLEDEYLLSLRDLYTLNHVPELIEAGIHSFKIEGRMKRPEYIAGVVKAYRKAIDQHLSHQKYDTFESDSEDVAKLFNRKFTAGYLFNQTGLQVLNAHRPNHMGIPIGKVISVSKKGIKIQLNHVLNQGDGIRILNKNEDVGMLVNKINKDGYLVSSANIGDIIEIETSHMFNVNFNDLVLLTSDKLQLQSIQKDITHVHNRIQIKGEFVAKLNEKIQFSINDGLNFVSVYSEDVVSSALKQPISEDNIRVQCEKLKDTVYVYSDLDIQLDNNIFISLKVINELRRQAISLLNEKRYKAIRNVNKCSSNCLIKQTKPSSKLVVIQNQAQYDALKDREDILLFSPRRILFNKEDVHFKGQRVYKSGNYNQDNIVIVSEIGHLNHIQEGQIAIADISLNVTNCYTVRFLEKCGISAVVISLEADIKKYSDIKDGYFKRYNSSCILGKVVYGHRECMIMETCIINSFIKDNQKQGCNECRVNQYKLINQNKQGYLVSQDDQCHSILLEEKPFIETQNTSVLDFEMILFSVETNPKQIQSIVK